MKLSILGVFWQAIAELAQALPLSEVRDRILAKYGRVAELTTVSNQLRTLLTKGCLEEVELNLAAPPVVRVQGVVQTSGRRPPTFVKCRSPFTAYRLKLPPEAVIRPMLQELAATYPEGDRHHLLIESDRVLGLSAPTIAQIERLLRKGKG